MDHNTNSSTVVVWHDDTGAACSTHGTAMITLLVDPFDGAIAFWACGIDGATLPVQPWH